MIRLILRRGHDRRVRAGHPWVFSNEIERFDGEPAPGDAVEIAAAGGESLGTGYYNPHSLIAARILSRRNESIDTAEFFHQRLTSALAYRQAFYDDKRSLRLVYGESDGLPGLIVDRYGDVLSVQFLTLGIDRRRELILAALLQIFQPTAIIARNDVAVRSHEGLPQQVEILYGDLPDKLIVTENGLRFHIDVQNGQKTGYFLDQKENHQSLCGRVEGASVLDLFCYSGNWAIHAARYGAKNVTGVDISPSAVALAEENARLNFQEQTCSFVQGDVFEWLRGTSKTKKRFDTIILDPPAFVKSRKKLPEAIKGYLTINRRAMELVEPGGYLFTCSCSHHMDRELFLETLRKAGVQAGRTVHLVEMRGQAYDHPVLLSCPETEYLKCAVLRLP